GKKRVNTGVGCGPHLNPRPLLLSAQRRGEGGKKMSGIGNISALFVIFVIFVIFAVKKFVLRMFWVPVRDSAVHYTTSS
ncbi:MAG: hypothetical protein WAV74_24720, partial [Anaerolineae bacterium]